MKVEIRSIVIIKLLAMKKIIDQINLYCIFKLQVYSIIIIVTRVIKMIVTIIIIIMIIVMIIIIIIIIIRK